MFPQEQLTAPAIEVPAMEDRNEILEELSYAIDECRRLGHRTLMNKIYALHDAMSAIEANDTVILEDILNNRKR